MRGAPESVPAPPNDFGPLVELRRAFLGDAVRLRRAFQAFADAPEKSVAEIRELIAMEDRAELETLKNEVARLRAELEKSQAACDRLKLQFDELRRSGHPHPVNLGMGGGSVGAGDEGAELADIEPGEPPPAGRDDDDSS
jgi:hypothetical protein